MEANTPETAINLGTMLLRLVAELEAAARSCTTLQWSISSLLDKVDHPDLAEEIHMLQDLDRMQQVLVDIAAILDVASGSVQDLDTAEARIGTVIKLESLRCRLFSVRPPTALSGPEPLDDAEITWF
jgi:hypothetical protein